MKNSHEKVRIKGLFCKRAYITDDILQQIVCVSTCDITSHMSYVSRLLKITGLFCKRAYKTDDILQQIVCVSTVEVISFSHVTWNSYD